MPSRPSRPDWIQALNVDIHIEDEARTFTTLDKIEGTVTVAVASAVRLSDIDIQLVGTSESLVETVPTAPVVSGKCRTSHVFLSLLQSGLQDLVPPDGHLKAGETYKLPFCFIVPERLLPAACQHPVFDYAVRSMHLELPPSLGDGLAACHLSAPNDFASDYVSTRYEVYARVRGWKGKARGTMALRTLAAEAHRVRVVPAYPERPLEMFNMVEDYFWRAEKLVRTGVLRTRKGMLIMEAMKREVLRLQCNQDCHFNKKTAIAAKIMLRFDPESESVLPPRLGHLITTLKILTFFGGNPRHNFPSPDTFRYDLSQGMRSHERVLSRRSMSGLEWSKQGPQASHVEEPPEYSLQRNNAESETSNDKTRGLCYLAEIMVPVALPVNEVFVPSFHSCLLSRAYSLSMTLRLGDAAMGGKVALNVPIEIVSNASPAYTPRRSYTAELHAESDTHIQIDTLPIYSR